MLNGSVDFSALLLLVAGVVLVAVALRLNYQKRQRRQRLLQLQQLSQSASRQLTVSGQQELRENTGAAVTEDGFFNSAARWLDQRLLLPQTQQQQARAAGLLKPGLSPGQTGVAGLGRWFWLIKITAALSVAVLLWPETASENPNDQNSNALPYVLLVLAMVLANILPEWLFAVFCRDRARRLQGQLPQVFDLLALCLEAGLSIDAALARIGGEMRAVNPALARHFSALSDDLRITSSRAQAFHSLAERLPVDDLRQLSWLIAQADDYGTPLAQGLRELAGHSRTLHSLALEERMAKVPAQMSVPLMVFIILPLVALLAGPAFVMLLRQLSGEG